MAVRVLNIGRAGVPLGMRPEDLNGLLREAMCKKEPMRRRWGFLVRLVQQTFVDRTPTEELAWATM